MFVASEPAVALVEIPGGFGFAVAKLIGRICGVDGEKVGNTDSIAITFGFADVTPAMVGVDLVICGAGVALTFVGGFTVTGVGFIMTGVGFIMTGVGLVMTGIGFVMTGIELIMAGVEFIAGAMAGIPMDSRFLVSSASTERDTFRLVPRVIALRRSCS
jgi:hypothetical protein